MAQKDSTRMGDLRQQGFRVGHAKFQMLGRDPVGQGRRLGQVAHCDDRAILAPACARNRAPFQCFKALFHRLRDGLAKCRISGDQNGLRAFVMFGL